MLIGMMNNPQKNLTDEIAFAAKHNFDFIDYTQEPPGGMITKKDTSVIRTMLQDLNLEIVGHYAWYLPVDMPFVRIQQATVIEMIEQMDIFAEIGVRKVTLHGQFAYPDRLFPYESKLDRWCKALESLVTAAEQRELTLMLENVAGRKDHFRIIRDLLKCFPGLGFHLDVGHANLAVPTQGVFEYLKKFKKRLIHIHLSDNLARREDLHLPLGAGGISWKPIINLIKETGYDGTITLEVFSRNRTYLINSRDFLRTLWDSC